jgi:hypothetical protein
VRRWLPAWDGQLTPHGLRHFCASSLYARGVDLKAIQEPFGTFVAVDDDPVYQPSGIASDGRVFAGCLVQAEVAASKPKWRTDE